MDQGLEALFHSLDLLEIEVLNFFFTPWVHGKTDVVPFSFPGSAGNLIL